MRIQHNITAMNAYRNYNNNTSAIGKNLEKLSSGYKINRAGDDAAGLAVSQKMRLQIAGLAQAQKNAKSGISYIQTAEGALQEVHEMLERMYTLAEQSANGTFDDSTDRVQLQKEVNNLMEEIDRIGRTANFNGMGIFAEYGSGSTKGTEGDADALTADDITAFTTPDVTFTDGDDDVGNGGAAAKNATLEFDVAGVAFAKDGTVTVGLAGKSYEVEVTKDMTAEEFATALEDAINADPLTDEDAGAFTAAATDTAITLTSANKKAVKASDGLDANLTIEPKAADEDTEIADSYESTIELGGGTTLAADDTITIGSKEYTIVADSATGDQVGLDTASTFEDQIKAAIDLYNEEEGEDFTAAYADGKVTFTVKEGKEPSAAPTLTISDAAGKISAGEVTPVDDGNGGKKGGGEITFWVGAEYSDDNKLTLKTMHLSHSNMTIATDPADTGFKDPGTVEAGSLTDLDITKADEAMKWLDKIKTASNAVSDMRGTLGAMQNRLDHTIKNLSVMQENMQDAESVIRDTDVAEEMMAYTKNSILVQSAQAMLAQANQLPQGVLQLLQ